MGIEIAMIYELRLNIPKNIPADDPVSDVLPVHPGTLKRVEVVFPAGCVGLVHLRIFYWERQLFPSNPDSDFSGDDAHLEFDEDLDLTGAPFEFRAEGWNLDDTYEHTPIVRMLIVPFERDVRRLLAGLAVGPSGPAVSYGG